MNQTDAVFDYMQAHGSIDPVRAVKDLGIYRLGARIWDLKRLGVNIESEMKKNPATGKHWKEYRLCTNSDRL